MDNSAYIKNLIRGLSNESSELSKEEMERFEALYPNQKEEGDKLSEIWELTSRYKSSATFDADSAFAKFKNNNLSEVSNTVPVVRPKKGRVVFFRRRMVLTAVAACFGLLFASMFLFNNSTSLYNSSDAIQQHLLADGSSLHLMPGASIAIANEFGENNREITLKSGEVLFDVKKSTLPFEVDIRNSEIRVTGTQFLVSNADQISVDLYEGSIDYFAQGKKYALVAGMSLQESSQGVSVSQGNDASILDLVNNKLSFDKTPLNEVFERLSLFYGVEFESKVDIPQDIHFTSILLEDASLKSILETLEVSFGADIEQISDKKYQIQSISQN